MKKNLSLKSSIFKIKYIPIILILVICLGSGSKSNEALLPLEDSKIIFPELCSISNGTTILKCSGKIQDMFNFTGSSGTKIQVDTNNKVVHFISQVYQNNTGINLGNNGLGIYTTNNVAVLQFLKIACLSGMTCSSNATNIILNATGIGHSSGITSINTDTTAAQIIQGSSGNITVTDAGNVHTINLGSGIPTSSSPVFTNGSLVTNNNNYHKVPIINPTIPFAWHIYKNNTLSPAVYYVANSTGYVRNSTNYPWVAINYCLSNLANAAINGNTCFVHTGLYNNTKDTTWHTINMVGGNALVFDKGVYFQVPSRYTGNFISLNDTNRAFVGGIAGRALITEAAPQQRLWNCVSVQSSHVAGAYFNTIQQLACNYPNSVIQMYENSTANGSFINNNLFNDITSNFPRIVLSYNLTVAYQNGNGFHNDMFSNIDTEDSFSATYPTFYGVKNICCTMEQFVNDVWNDNPAGFQGMVTSRLNNNTIISGGNMEPIIDNSGGSISINDATYKFAQALGKNSQTINVTTTFAPNATREGFNFGSFAGNPSNAKNGGCWYSTISNVIACKDNGVTTSMFANGISNTITASQTSSGAWNFQNNNTISTGQNQYMGTANLTTTAVRGYLYASVTDGPPTGTPASHTGGIPFVIDGKNNKLCFYNGAWKCASFS